MWLAAIKDFFSDWLAAMESARSACYILSLISSLRRALLRIPLRSVLISLEYLHIYLDPLSSSLIVYHLAPFVGLRFVELFCQIGFFSAYGLAAKGCIRGIEESIFVYAHSASPFARFSTSKLPYSSSRSCIITVNLYRVLGLPPCVIIPSSSFR